MNENDEPDALEGEGDEPETTVVETEATGGEAPPVADTEPTPETDDPEVEATPEPEPDEVHELDVTEDTASIRGVLDSIIGDLVTGGTRDVKEFGEAISTELAVAFATQDLGAIRELKAQALALATHHRVNLNTANWKLVTTGIRVALATVI